MIFVYIETSDIIITIAKQYLIAKASEFFESDYKLVFFICIFKNYSPNSIWHINNTTESYIFI